MRKCPSCNESFSNWRLFAAQLWSPFFHCPHCKIQLTHSLLKKFRNDGALMGVLAVSIANHFSSITLFSVFFISVIAYEYFILKNAEILIFDEHEKSKHEERIKISPKYGPAVSILAMMAGVMLILIGVFAFSMIEITGIGGYSFLIVIICSGIIGLWVGAKILSKNRISNELAQSDTPERQREP